MLAAPCGGTMPECVQGRLCIMREQLARVPPWRRRRRVSQRLGLAAVEGVGWGPSVRSALRRVFTSWGNGGEACDKEMGRGGVGTKSERARGWAEDQSAGFGQPLCAARQ